MADDQEKNTEILKEHAPPELDEGDKKIAKKRAKKHGIPQEVAEEGRRQEKSIKIVQELTNEYNAKLNELGFVLEAVLKFSPKGIKPGFDLRPMNGDEMAFFKGKKESDARGEKEKVESTVDEKNTKESEESTEEVKDESAAVAPVEPLDVPKAQ